METDRWAEVRDLFERALEQPTTQRFAWLEARCDDSALRREVTALLQRDPGNPTPQPSAEPRRVAEVSGYRLLERVGEGGMGEVWLAEQRRPLRRKVALKIVKPGMDSREVVARFEAERQALALMDHPGIAKVFDAGTTAGGRPYFAMELVAGLPVTEYCNHHRLPLPDRLRIFIATCDAVQHAHQKGVVHRDLKPSNLLVTRDGDRAVPKVIDFGIAKALDRPLTERTLHTIHGQMIGTPEYMSPEQLDPAGLGVDTRSDVYSLGVVLYELVSDMRPFDAGDTRRSDPLDMRRRIREEEPLKPSTRCSTAGGQATEIARRRRTEPRTLVRALKGDLDWIVMRCLEKDPSRRYASASELAADVRRHLDHEPVEAGPPSTWYRFKKVLRKRRGPIAAALAFVLALVVGLSLAVWQYHEASASAELANERLRHSLAANLASESERALENDPMTALLLALRAVELDENAETLGHLQNALQEQYLVRRFEGHTDDVTAADFGPRTRRIVSGSRDGTVRLWAESGEELLVLPHGGAVVSVSFSPDEQRIFTVAANGDDSQVARVYGVDGELLAAVGEGGRPPLADAVWDVSSAQLLSRAGKDGPVVLLDAHGVPVRELERPQVLGPLTVSAEGHLVRLYGRRHLTVWPRDGAPPTVLRFRKGHAVAYREQLPVDRFSGLAFDPRGEWFATAQDDGLVRLFSWSGERVGLLEGHTYWVSGVDVDPSGDTIRSASHDGTVRLWTRDGRQTAVLHAGNEVLGARFSDSGRRIFAWGRDVWLWSVTGRPLARLRGRIRWRTLLDLDADDGTLLARDGSTVCLWRLAGAHALHLRCDFEEPWGIACRATGEILVTNQHGTVAAFGTDGRVEKVFDTGGQVPTYSVAVSPDGSVVDAATRGVVHGWDWRTTEKLWEHSLGHPNVVTDVHFLAGGNRLVVGSIPSRQCHVVDLDTGERFAFEGARVLVAPDRTRIAILRDEGADIGRVEGTRLVREITFPAARAIAFHPDGRGFAVASGSTVELFDRDPTGVESDASVDVRHPVSFLAFSPDGTRLLVGMGENAVMTDLDGRELFRIQTPGGRRSYVPSLAFSPDGRYVVSGVADGVQLWPASESLLLDMARAYADRVAREVDLGEYADLLAAAAALRAKDD